MLSKVVIIAISEEDKIFPFPFSEPTVGPGAAQRAVPPVPDGGPGRRSLAQLPGTLAPRPARASSQCCPRAQHGEVVDHGPKCRLYWCLIEFIYWRCSQSCWYGIFDHSYEQRPSNLLTGSSHLTRIGSTRHRLRLFW